MNRRTFFQRSIGAVAAAVAMPFLPKAPASLPVAPISMRFVKAFNEVDALQINRFDVIYGATILRPNLACRISE